MSIADELEKIIVKDPSIPRPNGEICFFKSQGQLLTGIETFKKTTNRGGIGVGVSVPITKHFRVGIGKTFGKSNTETKYKLNKIPCYFYLYVNHFGIFSNCSMTYIDMNDNITGMDLNSDSFVIRTQQGEITVFFSKSDLERLKKTWGIIGEARKAGIDIDIVSNSAKTSIKDSEDVSIINENYAKTLFLWHFRKHASAVLDNEEYPLYFNKECGIHDAEQYHKKLIEEGYFEETNNANDSSSDAIKQYVLSDLGKNFIDAHQDYIKIHTHKRWSIDIKEYDEIKAGHTNPTFLNIVWGIFNKRINDNIDKFGLARNTYYDMHELLKEEGKVPHALQMLLMVLFMDINNEYPTFAPAVVDNIVSMKGVLDSEMIDRAANMEVERERINRDLFAEIVNAIVDGSFSEEYYMRKIN